MPADLLEEQQLPRSAVRHQPIAPDVLTQHVKIPRASRARQHHEPHTTGGPPLVGARPLPRPKASSSAWLIYLVLGMLSAMVLLWLGQLIWNWGTTISDDLRYGRPRTTNVDHVTGHETGNTVTHFTALNINGQVYIIEISGGSNTSHLLIGPRLISPGADLAPVLLSVPGDPQHPDLLVTIDGIQVKFRNTGSAYVPTS